MFCVSNYLIQILLFLQIFFKTTKKTRILLSRGHGPSHLGTLSTNSSGHLRLQHQFLPNQHQNHYQQTHQTLRSGVPNGAKSLYKTPRFNQNSYDVSPSPSSFRYYSSSVEYLAGDFEQKF